MKKLILLLITILLILSGCNHNAPENKNDNTSKKSSSSTKSTAQLSTQGQYYSVQGTVDGIKITIKQGVTIRDNAGSTFKVFDSSGKELPLYIAIDNEERNNRKEYIYRFVEANKEYVVEWFCIFVDDKGKESGVVWDKTKCTPKGGLNLSDYLNVSNVENAKMSLNYDNEASSFVIKLQTSAKTLSDFAKDDSIFNNISFKFRTLLGELYWTHTEYVDDQWLVLKRSYAKTDPSYDISDAKTEGFQVYKSFPDYQKKEYNYKYCGQLIKQFVYDEGSTSSYNETIYENTIWTSQLQFN